MVHTSYTMKIDKEYCNKIALSIFKTLRIFLLSTCIDDLKNTPISNYKISEVSDEELLDIVEKFQGPYLNSCNKLIKRFITKPVGLGPKECPEFEKIVDDLLTSLYNTTKALEVLITCICSVIGCLREINFRFYMNYVANNHEGTSILMEFNKFLKQDIIQDGFIQMLSSKIMDVYTKDNKFTIPKSNIQNNEFISMELNKESALMALKELRENSSNIPSVLRTGR